MEDRLNDLLKLKAIQDRVVTFRTEVPSVYAKYLTLEFKSFIKNLRCPNVESQTSKLDIPAQHEIDFSGAKISPQLQPTEILDQANNIKKCLQYSSRKE